jgi:hypothetical protein
MVTLHKELYKPHDKMRQFCCQKKVTKKVLFRKECNESRVILCLILNATVLPQLQGTVTQTLIKHYFIAKSN